MTMTDEEYGALRASAALWAGTSVLITNGYGEVLVQHVDYLETCLLPGGGVDPGESPAQGAAREVMEELGVAVVVERGLAVDWVSAGSVGAPAAMRFPGELLHFFDGGTWDEERIGAIRLPEQEIRGIEFVEPSRLPELMAPRDARRALSALRARVNGAGAVLLEDGLPIVPTVLDRVGVLRTPRARHRFPFRAGPVPDGLAVRESWGWLFAPDGRVLVLLDSATGAARLPGGTAGAADDGDPVGVLVRAVAEEAGAEFGDLVMLGHLTAPGERVARVRYAAALTELGPAQPHPVTGAASVRVLATPEQALELFDWGASGTEQLTAVHRARERLGIPRAARQAVTEVCAATAPARPDVNLS
ncbi:NUDIX domain-containing protein [Streptomyces fradiae]|uniref:NUDIX domain-containing protein n=1 Tax=Streptomyces fradiae TaxID=1906 RepID=UPI0035133D44